MGFDMSLVCMRFVNKDTTCTYQLVSYKSTVFSKKNMATTKIELLDSLGIITGK